MAYRTFKLNEVYQYKQLDSHSILGEDVMHPTHFGRKLPNRVEGLVELHKRYHSNKGKMDHDLVIARLRALLRGGDGTLIRLSELERVYGKTRAVKLIMRHMNVSGKNQT